MKTRRNRSLRKKGGKKMTYKHRGGKSSKSGKSGKNWTTAIQAAQDTLQKTGSFEAARQSLRKQALSNARKLFGSLGSV
jgi:hypothetical protein